MGSEESAGVWECGGELNREDRLKSERNLAEPTWRRGWPLRYHLDFTAPYAALRRQGGIAIDLTVDEKS